MVVTREAVEVVFSAEGYLFRAGGDFLPGGVGGFEVDVVGVGGGDGWEAVIVDCEG